MTTKKEPPKTPAKKDSTIEELRDEVIKLEHDLMAAGKYNDEAKEALNTVLGIIDKYR